MYKPLAARYRPNTWNALHGVAALENPASPLYSMRKTGEPRSCIIYGPPGCGKTTVARILANMQKQHGGDIHHGTGGEIAKKDLDTILKETRKKQPRPEELSLSPAPPPPLLFLDEVHRLTRVQSEFLLQSCEEGEIVLVGATTENPYISLGPALLSRCPVIQLTPYTQEALHQILTSTYLRAVSEKFPGSERIPTQETINEIARLAGGDARMALNLLEQVFTLDTEVPTSYIPEILRQRIAPMATRMDDFGDLHYDITSAFIKSMRGSDPDATLHWLARLLDGGVDPRYIARRIAIHASEDVGMADPMALVVANAAFQAVEKIGYPECRLILAQAALHVALAPKSPAVNNGISLAQQELAAGYQPAMPAYPRDTHYKNAAKLGAQGYVHPGKFPHMRYPANEKPDFLPGKSPGSYWIPNNNDPQPNK